MSASRLSAEIGLCLFLATADGEVSEAEIGALSERLGHLLGDDASSTDLGELVSAEMDALDEMGHDRYVATLAERLPRPARLRALRAALAVAYADGLAAEEERAFRTVARALDVDTLEVDSLLDLVPTFAGFRPPRR